MGRISKFKLAFQSNASSARESKEMVKGWNKVVDRLDNAGISNSRGRTRTFEENCIVLNSVKMFINVYLDLIKDEKVRVVDLTWKLVYDKVAQNLGMTRMHVVELCQHIATENEVVVFADYRTPQRGRSSPNYVDKRVKLEREELLALVNEVDNCHSKGETITNKKIRSFIECKFAIQMSRTTMARYFKKLGLRWKNVRCKKRNMGNYAWMFYELTLSNSTKW